jgi:hypothetical protein
MTVWIVVCIEKTLLRTYTGRSRSDSERDGQAQIAVDLLGPSRHARATSISFHRDTFLSRSHSQLHPCITDSYLSILSHQEGVSAEFETVRNVPRDLRSWRVYMAASMRNASIVHSHIEKIFGFCHS